MAKDPVLWGPEWIDEAERLRLAERFVRDIVEDVFKQKIPDAQVRKLARKVLLAVERG